MATETEAEQEQDKQYVRTQEFRGPPPMRRESGHPDTYQIGGNHYQRYPIQPVHFIQANRLPFIEGSIIKYIMRYRERGGAEDLMKIKHYVNFLLVHDYHDGDRSAVDDY